MSLHGHCVTYPSSVAPRQLPHQGEALNTTCAAILFGSCLLFYGQTRTPVPTMCVGFGAPPKDSANKDADTSSVSLRLPPSPTGEGFW